MERLRLGCHLRFRLISCRLHAAHDVYPLSPLMLMPLRFLPFASSIASAARRGQAITDDFLPAAMMMP